jgi:periplasmic protein TonB
MRRSFTIVSIVVHTIVVGAVCIAQLLAVGDLPNPRTPLTFAGATPIRLMDIPLPAPRRGASSGPLSPSGAHNVAPIAAPDDIHPERSSAAIDPGPTDTVGVERGIESGSIFGTAAAMPAAPPPPPSPPTTPVRLHAGMERPRKIVHVDPVYPRVAQEARIAGTVILDTVIDVNGHVTSVRVLRSIPLLDQAAIDAVRGWTFTPTRLNGVPVPIALTVTVRFALSER